MYYYRYNGPFDDHFRTKTDNVVYQFATPECRRYPKPTVVRIDLLKSKSLPRVSGDIYIDDVTSGTKSMTIKHAFMRA